MVIPNSQSYFENWLRWTLLVNVLNTLIAHIIDPTQLLLFLLLWEELGWGYGGWSKVFCLVCFDEAILALQIFWYTLKYKTLEFHFKNYCITSTTDTLSPVFIPSMYLELKNGLFSPFSLSLKHLLHLSFSTYPHPYFEPQFS